MEPVPRGAWLLPALALLPLLVGLGDELQEIDPAQYAEVGRRIALSGDFVTLHDGWGAFLNKPPMAMWLIALAIRLMGATSIAARLPSFLAGCVTVWAVARIGRRLWDETAGWVAASLYAASFSLLLSVADPKIDALVTTFITLSVLCLVEARREPRYLWGAWAFAGFGLLTKGPIGLIIPALAVFPEVIRRRWDG
ncbi:MAG: ArnT family glycosyltransferase, partial [Myxococcaceae bacterium]